MTKRCFICDSFSEDCGHREPEVAIAQQESTDRAFLAQVLRERYNSKVVVTRRTKRLMGELMRKFQTNGAHS